MASKNGEDQLWADTRKFFDKDLPKATIATYNKGTAQLKLEEAHELIERMLWWIKNVDSQNPREAIKQAKSQLNLTSPSHVTLNIGGSRTRNTQGHGQGEQGTELTHVGTESKTAPKAPKKSDHHAALPPELANFHPLGEIDAIKNVCAKLRVAQENYVKAGWPEQGKAASTADLEGHRNKLRKLVADTTKEMLIGIQSFIFQDNIDEDLTDVVKAGNEHFLDVYKSVYHTIENSEKAALEEYNKQVIAAKAVVDTTKGRRIQKTFLPVELLTQALNTKKKYGETIQHVIDVMQELGEIRPGDIKFSAAPVKKLQRVVEKSMLKAKIPGHANLTCDLVRGMAICTNMSVIHKFISYLTRHHTGFTDKTGKRHAATIERVRLKDRFVNASDGGWRDFMDNFIIRGLNPAESDEHICELQIVHDMMIVARKGLPGHVVYGKVRNACEISLLYNGGTDKKHFDELFWKGKQQAALAMLFIKCKGQHWNPTQRAGWCMSDDLSKWAGVGLNSQKKVTSLDLSKRKLEDEGLMVEMLRPLKQLKEINLKESSRHIRSSKNDDYQSLGDKELHVISSSRELATRLIEKANFDFCASITDDGLDKFAAGCPELREIELQECDEVSDEGVKKLVGHCKKLRRLNLKECDKISDEGLKNLGTVRTLEELDLQDCDKITDNGLTYLKGMKVLNLNYCSEITDKGLTNIAIASGTSLEDISLTELQVSDTGVTDLVRKTPNLKSISLYQCRKIGDAAVSAIAENCDKLEKADFQYCTRITSVSLRSLAQNCKLLKDLKIRNCEKANDTVLQELIKHCPKLERLDCFGCPMITESAVQEAKSKISNLVVDR